MPAWLQSDQAYAKQTCGGGAFKTLLVGAVCVVGAGFASRIGTGFPGVALAARAYPWLPSLIPPGSGTTHLLSRVELHLFLFIRGE